MTSRNSTSTTCREGKGWIIGLVLLILLSGAVVVGVAYCVLVHLFGG